MDRFIRKNEVPPTGLTKGRRAFSRITFLENFTNF